MEEKYYSKKKDSLTKLNTQLNKSMVLMEDVPESATQQNKSNKSIRINTKVQPPTVSSAHRKTHRKSILKKNGTKCNDEILSGSQESQECMESESQEVETNTMSKKTNAVVDVDDVDSSVQVLNKSSRKSLQGKSSMERPANLQDLIQEEILTMESTGSTFSLDDISDSEDIWIMDIPMTVNPEDLNGQILTLGDKSKFKIGTERYCAINHDVKCNVTCVFNTGKVKPQYKTVNIKPTGFITIRRKLSGIPKVKPLSIENPSVPFPKNLRTRHPLFGVTYEDKIKNDSKGRKSLSKRKR